MKIIKEKEANLLVSDDKFLLGLFGIQNKIIFSDETKFKKGIFIHKLFQRYRNCFDAEEGDELTKKLTKNI